MHSELNVTQAYADWRTDKINFIELFELLTKHGIINCTLEDFRFVAHGGRK